MASCLVPEFPAVMVAVEHLKELDNELSRAGIRSACPHLAELTAAITGLEAERRTTHEDLEVETILNSDLRHKSQCLGLDIRKEMMADVEAARAANYKEIQRLREELCTVCQMKDDASKRHLANVNQSKTLYTERAQLMSEHGDLVAALNDQISQKYSLEVELEQTLEQTKKLECRLAAVEQDKLTLWQNMLLERDAERVQKENLYKQEEQVEGKNKWQKQVIHGRKKEMEEVKKKKEDTVAHLNELTIEKSKLESNIGKLSMSRKQQEQRLAAEVQKHLALEEQEKMLKKKFGELEVEFSCIAQRLKDDIAKVEGKIIEGEATRQHLQDALAEAREIYKRQQKEENEVRSDRDNAAQELQNSKAKVDDRIAFIVKYNQDIREMEKLLTEVEWNQMINKRIYEKDKGELCYEIDVEKKNIAQLEEEKFQLQNLLGEEEMKQEEYVAKMNDDISNAKRRFEELLQEMVALQQQDPKSEDSDELRKHITQAEIRFKEIENMLHQAIQVCIAEAQSFLWVNEEKQKAAEKKEEILKEVKGKCDEQKNRYQSVQTHWNELESKKTQLELSIEELKEETSALLEHKEQSKAQLEKLQEDRITTLNEHASKLTAIEASIYNNSVKLEQFRVENSRLHLAVRQITEDTKRACQDRERYLQEMQQFNLDTEALVKRLQESWREDARITQESQTRDSVLLEYFTSLMEHLTSRREQLGNVEQLVHQNTVEFCRWLGEKIK